MIGSVIEGADAKGKGILYLVIYIIILIVIVVIAYKIYGAINTGASIIGTEIGQQVIESKTGINPDRQDICQEVADSCRAAMTIVPFTHEVVFIISDDIANALNKLMDKKEAKLCSQLFKQKQGFSLGDTLRGRFDIFNSYKDKVSADIFNGLI